LNAKNLENSTALDIAASAEIKGILLSAGAKPSSKVKDGSKLEHKLRSNVTFLDQMLVYVLRIRKDISEEQRNAFLIVATLIATATYQTALSPPGGVYQGNAGDCNNNVNTTSLNSNATISQKYVGKSVINEGDFLSLSIFNALSILLSTMTIYLLTSSGLIGFLLFSPIFWFALYCFINNMRLISPTFATSTFNLVIGNLFYLLYGFVYWSFCVVYKRLKVNGKNKEIKIRNRVGGTNKW